MDVALVEAASFWQKHQSIRIFTTAQDYQNLGSDTKLTHPDPETEACRPSRVSDVAESVSGSNLVMKCSHESEIDNIHMIQSRS